jgi:oxygen-dependent protoporphyrinogen oxidase
MVDGLAVALGARGVDIRCGTTVRGLERPGDGGWVVVTESGPLLVDGLVLAVPAPVAAFLLEPHDGDAATLLRGIEYASVATVTLVYPGRGDPAAAVSEGTGLLVPHGSPSPSSLGTDEPLLVTACTYLSTKWPHLDRPGQVLVRASVGRFGDDRPAALSDAALVARVQAEVAVLLDLEAAPSASHVTRWPDAFPQYRVHHLLRVAGIESATHRLPALAVAGAALRGVGIPACVASGRAAARTVLEAMAGEPTGAGPTP